jgi:putative transposase
MSTRKVNPLFHFLAKVVEPELSDYITYLKAENEVLRSMVPRGMRVNTRDKKKLLKAGAHLGGSIALLLSIVSYRTFQRWKSGAKSPGKIKPVGRRRTALDIEEAVIRIRKETGWGFNRILGELIKLGFPKISRATVKRILMRNGYDPDGSDDTWRRFLKRHWETLWACDFLSKDVLTPFGVKSYYIFFAIQVATRRVVVTGITQHPDAAWMNQQAKNLSIHFHEIGSFPTLFIRDGDGKFQCRFDEFLALDGVRVLKIPARSPNLNAFAERWIQSFKHECLNHFVVFGEKHLRYIVREYLEYYNRLRPHQGIGNVCLTEPLEKVTGKGEVLCDERLGGILKHYYRETG